MASRPTRSTTGGRQVPRFQLRSSHSGRVRLRVSHRGVRTWTPPAKEADAVFERDLLPAIDGSPGRHK